MLVITRIPGEGFYITLGGEQVYVRFLCIDNGGARIGIDAPRHVKILREELVDDNRPTSRAGL